MTSAKARSNRNNAQRSTGPRTTSGRRASARNAVSHGLTLPVEGSQWASAIVEPLIREIAGTDASPETRRLVRQIALYEANVQRCCASRERLVHESGLYTAQPDHTGAGRNTPVRLTEARLARIQDLAKRLQRLARYERRALAERSRAIAACDLFLSGGAGFSQPAAVTPFNPSTWHSAESDRQSTSPQPPGNVAPPLKVLATQPVDVPQGRDVQHLHQKEPAKVELRALRGTFHEPLLMQRKKAPSVW